MEAVKTGAPDTTEVERMIPAVQGMATAIVVSNEGEAEVAANFVREVKAKKQVVLDLLNPSVEKAHAAHKSLTELRKKLTDPFDEAERAVRLKINHWADEEQRKRDEAARLLREQARKEQEEAALREAEARKQAGVADLDLDAAARDAGFQAELVHDEALEAAPKPKVAGVSMGRVWKAQIVDKEALVKYVAANPAVLHYLDPNQKLLDSMAKQQHEKLSIPGVRPVSSAASSIR